ncbi:MAG: YceD family protein, partial [Mycobacterium sp.]
MATHAKKAARRGPRSPLVIDVGRLGRRPGSMMVLETTVPSPSRMGLDLIGVDKGAPLELDLRLESVSEGVLVTGTVWAPTSGECAKCLQP